MGIKKDVSLEQRSSYVTFINQLDSLLRYRLLDTDSLLYTGYRYPARYRSSDPVGQGRT